MQTLHSINLSFLIIPFIVILALLPYVFVVLLIVFLWKKIKENNINKENIKLENERLRTENMFLRDEIERLKAGR